MLDAAGLVSEHEVAYKRGAVWPSIRNNGQGQRSVTKIKECVSGILAHCCLSTHQKVDSFWRDFREKLKKNKTNSDIKIVLYCVLWKVIVCVWDAGTCEEIYTLASGTIPRTAVWLQRVLNACPAVVVGEKGYSLLHVDLHVTRKWIHRKILCHFENTHKYRVITNKCYETEKAVSSQTEEWTFLVSERSTGHNYGSVMWLFVRETIHFARWFVSKS